MQHFGKNKGQLKMDISYSGYHEDVIYWTAKKPCSTKKNHGDPSFVCYAGISSCLHSTFCKLALQCLKAGIWNMWSCCSVWFTKCSCGILFQEVCEKVGTRKCISSLGVSFVRACELWNPGLFLLRLVLAMGGIHGQSFCWYELVFNQWDLSKLDLYDASV